MKRSRDTPRKPDWCPRLGNRCMCQVACPLRTAAELERSRAQEQLPRATGSVEWRPSVFLDSELGRA